MSKIKNIYFIYTIFFSIIQAEEVIYMLKEQICKEGILYENIVGYYLFEGYDSELSSPICVSENMNEINDLEYYYTEFFSETSESDYHTFVQKYRFKGIYMTFRLNNLDLSKYFEGIRIDYKNFNDQLIAFVKNILTENGMLNKDDNVYISDGRLNIVLLNKNLDNNIRDVGSKILHAAQDNKLHRELERLEKENNIKIYKFGLCSTGIDYATAISMRDYADVVWSCASKYVKSEIAPNAILQVGVKIPVYIMTEKGFEIVKNHLQLMNGGESLSDEDIKSQESVIINSKDGLKVLKKNNIHNCSDCPYPCV